MSQPLIHLIHSPEKLLKENSQFFQNLLHEFPYFQTAHLLYAQYLHHTTDPHFDEQLKITAAYAGNRRVLYQLISSNNSESQVQGDHPRATTPQDNTDVIDNLQLISGQTGQISSNISLKGSETSVKQADSGASAIVDQQVPKENNAQRNDSFTSDQRRQELSNTSLKGPETSAEEAGSNVSEAGDQAQKESHETEKALSTHSLDIEILKEAANASFEKQITSSETPFSFHSSPHSSPPLKAQEEQKVKTSQPNTFNQKHSFSDWLTLLKKEDTVIPSQVSDSEKQEKAKVSDDPALGDKEKKEDRSPEKKNYAELIDKFIATEPKLSSPGKTEFFSPINMARQSVTDDISFITETLAKIYVKQGNYAKAIKAYQKLSLKYPEKKLYFADQIKSIEELIKNK